MAPVYPPPGTYQYPYIRKITFPSGAYIRYEYGGHGGYAPGPGLPPDSNIADEILLRAVSADGGTGNEKIWTYARTNVPDLLEWRRGGLETRGYGDKSGRRRRGAHLQLSRNRDGDEMAFRFRDAAETRHAIVDHTPSSPMVSPTIRV
jgi:hypothetical protein